MISLLLFSGLDGFKLISNVLITRIEPNGLLNISEGLVVVLKLGVGLRTKVKAFGVLVINVSHLSAFVDGDLVIAELVRGNRTIQQTSLSQVLVLLLLFFHLNDELAGL